MDIPAKELMNVVSFSTIALLIGTATAAASGLSRAGPSYSDESASDSFDYDGCKISAAAFQSFNSAEKNAVALGLLEIQPNATDPYYNKLVDRLREISESELKYAIVTADTPEKLKMMLHKMNFELIEMDKTIGSLRDAEYEIVENKAEADYEFINFLTDDEEELELES